MKKRMDNTYTVDTDEAEDVIRDTVELQHLAPYLPYEMRIVPLYRSMGFMGGFHEEYLRIDVIDRFEMEDIIPLLHPISEIFNRPDILDEMSDNQIEAFKAYGNINDLPFGAVRKCFEESIDVFNLICRGLAIDINQYTEPDTKNT